MPELPEVETMRRSLLPAIGSQILSVVQPDSKYRPILIKPDFNEFQRILTGKTIVSIDRLGKRVVVQIDNGSSLIFQPKMAGLVMMSTPPNTLHLRMVIELSPNRISKRSVPRDESINPRIVYWDQRGLGTVQLWTSEEMTEYLQSGLLGPDALAVTLDEFIHRFQDTSRPIKPILLDQSRLAGIGNLYASEILHQSRVHPERLCNQITKASWVKIYHSTRAILLKAIEQEGSTLSDGTYRKSKEDPGGYQNSHQVYDRAGQSCKSCKQGLIIRIVQAQRSTFFCPRCQKV